MRMHGRNGLIYLSVHNGDDPSPLAYQASWSVAFPHDTWETTASGDAAKTYVAGLADVSGQFAGFIDDSTSQAYIAATDGLPRNMYIYPSSLNMGQFFSGSVLTDLQVTGAVTGAVAVTVPWVQAAGVQVTRTDPASGASPAAAVAAGSGWAAVNA